MDSPENCRNMTELRAAIDRLDAAIVAQLARRAALIDRAIEIKTGEGLPARIDARIEDVVARVRGAALDAGLDPDLAERLWRDLIEWSIAREERALGPGQGKQT